MYEHLNALSRKGKEEINFYFSLTWFMESLELKSSYF